MKGGKEGRNVSFYLSFYSHFYSKEGYKNAADILQYITQLCIRVEGKANVGYEVDQERGSRQNTLHALTYCFLTSCPVAAREWVQCEEAGSEQEQVMCVCVRRNQVKESSQRNRDQTPTHPHYDICP